MRNLMLVLIPAILAEVCAAQPVTGTYWLTRRDVKIADSQCLTTLHYADIRPELEARIWECACSELGTKPSIQSRGQFPELELDPLVSSVIPGYCFVHRTRLRCDDLPWDYDDADPLLWAAVSTTDSADCFRIQDNFEQLLEVDIAAEDSLLSRKLLECLLGAARLNQVSRLDAVMPEFGEWGRNVCVLVSESDLATEMLFYGSLADDISGCPCYDDSTEETSVRAMLGDLRVAPPTLERLEVGARLTVSVFVDRGGVPRVSKRRRPFGELYGLALCRIAVRDGHDVTIECEDLQTWSPQELVDWYTKFFREKD